MLTSHSEVSGSRSLDKNFFEELRMILFVEAAWNQAEQQKDTGGKLAILLMPTEPRRLLLRFGHG
jgi:hypothetical protein